MRRIVRIKFGSHLYGTATPASDVDFKSVYIPSTEDILLQKVKQSFNTKRVKAFGEKNLPGEEEEEAHSLQRFLSLLAEGQTMALDMLFAPDWSFTEKHDPLWEYIWFKRDHLISKRSSAFIGYCRQQANKYGIKGSRVAAARAALAVLKALVDKRSASAKLGKFEQEINAVTGEFSKIIDIPLANGQSVRHWEVCGRKMPFTSSIGLAMQIMQRLVDEYGQRALQAENQQGVDWKALSHAVRVGHQAIELFTTKNITFPLPNAAHVLDVKLGRLPYQDVANEIEGLLEQVEAVAAKSSLPETPDLEFIDKLVCFHYRREVINGG